VVPITLNEHLATAPEIYCGFGLPGLRIRGGIRLTTLVSRCSDQFVPKLLPHDLVHHTFYSREAISSKPAVCTIVDMIPEVLPHEFPLGDPHQGKFEMARRCGGVIAISESTKSDILRLMPGFKAKLAVIPLAVDAAQFRSLSRAPAKVMGDYILFVGNRAGYKNFDRFSEAAAAILASNEGLRLVCAGGTRLTERETLPFREAGVLQRVEHRHVTDEQLASLYRGASCFIFPSLYEGFGLPILEAFALESPIAVSDIPCFREVAGDAALYFDPKNVDSIREAITELLAHGNLRRDLIVNGSKRLAEFSWDRTAELTARFYREFV
jgi:glycosyltransferase involved in cell wall biosynthesis